MRGFLLALLSVFLVGPAFGQYVYGEAGVTLPRGSFAFAKTGFQGGVTGRLPVVGSDVDLSAIVRVSYNVNPTPQADNERVVALLGPEVSYTRGQIFAKAQVGGGVSLAPWADQGTASMLRSRLAVGVEAPSGRQLSIGPTHAVTAASEWWWGLSCAFSF
jgi:hypothetical protein